MILVLSLLAAAVVLLWWVPPAEPWLPSRPRRPERPGSDEAAPAGAAARTLTRRRGRAGDRHRSRAVGLPRPASLVRGPRSSSDGAGAQAARAEAPPPGLVPEALELLALALLGGGSLGEATRTVAATLPGRAGDGLATVSAALREGVDTDDAWTEAGQGWDPARRSLELAAVAGVAPGPALRQTATDLRAEAVAHVEVATARLGVRMVLPLGLAFLPAFVLTTVLPLVLALTRDLSW